MKSCIVVFLDDQTRWRHERANKEANVSAKMEKLKKDEAAMPAYLKVADFTQLSNEEIYERMCWELAARRLFHAQIKPIVFSWKGGR